MRLAGAVVVGALLSPPAGPGAEPPRAAASASDVEAAVVQIVTIRAADGLTRVPRGSAFYVDAEGRLLTCAHVVDRLPGDEARRLRARDGSERTFRVLDVDREIDLALLSSSPPERFLALAGESLPELGDAALLAGVAGGSPDGGWAARLKRCHVVSLERRRVSGARRALSTRRRILTIKVDQIADLGQSGGPLVDEETFTAIGVVRANLESATGGLAGVTPRGYGAAVPLLYVRPFLAGER